MTRSTDSLTTVATGYGLSDTAVTLSFLRAHGIMALPIGFHTASVFWHWTTALGGMEVRVPSAQAKMALLLLKSLEAKPRDEAVEQAAPAPSISGPAWKQRLRDIVIFLIFQVPPPGRGIYAKPPSAAATALPQRRA